MAPSLISLNVNTETRKIITESARQCGIGAGKALKMWRRLPPAQKVQLLTTLKESLEAQEVEARNQEALDGTPAP